MADLPLPHLLFLRATHKSRQLSVIKKISNVSKLKTRLLTIGMPGNPAKVRLSTTGKAVLVPKDIIIPQKSHKAKREYMSATPLSDLRRILWKLYDEEDGQSMASQNVVAQSCSNGRLAGVSTNETMRRQDKSASLPRHGVQTRSKSNHIAPSSLATSSLHGNNIPRDNESDAASAATGKGFLTKSPEILGSLWDKAGRAGREEVIRETIYDMIRTLRVGVMRERQDFNSETQETINPHLQSVSLQVPKGFSSFQALRQELEMSSAGEQLYRLSRRVALAQFYNDYTNAQADPHGFLYPNQNEELSMKHLTTTRKRKRASSSYGAKRHGNRLATLVHNRIVDLTFPSLVLNDEDIEPEKAEAMGEERAQKRKAAS